MWDLLIHSWLKECVGLFFLTLLHEDVAIIAAAFSRVEYGLPIWLALSVLYSGVVFGDIFIYSLGRIAQKSPWLRSKLIGPKVDQVKKFIEGNFIRLVAICRVTPGLLFPTFIAIGWFRMPIRKFLVISLITAAVYTPVALAIVVVLGETVLYRFGYWAWGSILILVVIFPLRKTIRSFRKNGNRQFKHLLSISLLDAPVNQEAEKRKHHRGMPSLKGIKRLISFAEKIPAGLFYIPVGLRWLALSIRYRGWTLPTITNPLIESGGFWGESKSRILNDVGEGQRCWFANYFVFIKCNEDARTDLNEILRKMDETGLAFPVVVKPDIGWQGFGVRKIHDERELHAYISAYPENETLIVQQFIQYDGEAGVFYARMPDEPFGKVFSLTLRYFPYVIGDGKSSLHKLIENNPRTGFKSKYYFGSNPEHLGLSQQKLEEIPSEGEMVRLAFIGSIRIGGIYRDATHLITPELSKKFDEIAKSIPEFYFGRFDIRFHSTDHLKEAKEFSIIEINGAGSEPIHAWDPEVPFFRLYRELFRTQSLMFRIAVKNRKRGFKPESLYKFLKAVSHQNKLLKSYPPSG